MSVVQPPLAIVYVIGLPVVVAAPLLAIERVWLVGAPWLPLIVMVGLLPRLWTMLPWMSVTLILKVRVWLSAPAQLQVNRQLAESVPPLTVSDVQASLLADAAL